MFYSSEWPCFLIYDLKRLSHTHTNDTTLPIYQWDINLKITLNIRWTMRLVNKHSISPLHTSHTLTSKTFVQTHPDSSLCLCLCLCPSLWLTVIFISYWRTVLTLSMRCCCAISEAYTDTDILSEQQGEENLRLMDVIFHDHLFCPLSSSLWICPPFTLSNLYSVYFSVLFGTLSA